MLSKISSWIGERRGRSTKVKKFAPIEEETASEDVGEMTAMPSTKRGRAKKNKKAANELLVRTQTKQSRENLSNNEPLKRPQTQRGRRNKSRETNSRNTESEQAAETPDVESKPEPRTDQLRRPQPPSLAKKDPLGKSRREAGCNDRSETASCGRDSHTPYNAPKYSGNDKRDDKYSESFQQMQAPVNGAFCQHSQQESAVVDKAKAAGEESSTAEQPQEAIDTNSKAIYYRTGGVYPRCTSKWAQEVYAAPRYKSRGDKFSEDGEETAPEVYIKVRDKSELPKTHGLLCRVSKTLRPKNKIGLAMSEEKQAFLREFGKTEPDDDSRQVSASEGARAPDPSHNTANPHHNPFCVEYEDAKPVGRVSPRNRYLGLKDLDHKWVQDSPEQQPARRGVRVPPWLRLRRYRRQRAEHVARVARAERSVPIEDAIEVHDLDGAEGSSTSTVLVLHAL